MFYFVLLKLIQNLVFFPFFLLRTNEKNYKRTDKKSDF